MKKLKNRIRAIRSTLSVKTHKMPRVFIILMMLAINLVVLIVAAVIALIIDDTFDSFVEAFALGSVTWLLSPNSIMVIENPYTLFLAVVVLIIGIVLFSGTIIALITNALKDYFERKRTSSGRIYMNRHIVILNWNNKIPELVADLLNVKSLASRRISVIILSDVDRHYAEEKIRSAMLKTGAKKNAMKRLDCLIKHGDPLNQSELRDVSAEQSDTVIVMNRETRIKEHANLTMGDLNVIKILLTLGQLDISSSTTILAEVKQFESKGKILSLHETVDSLKDYRIIPICFDRRLGQIMAQTIIQQSTEDVYLELFSFKGAQVHTLDNIDFTTCLMRYSHAVPLKNRDGGLYVLCDAAAHKSWTVPEGIVEAAALTLKPFIETATQNIIIVGTNNKRSFIEASFEQYERLHNSRFNIEHIDDTDIERLAERLNDATEAVSVLLLSDETASDDALDANVINNLLYLKKSLKNEHIHVLVELLDPKNDRLIKDFDIDNTIISNKIVSLLLGQVALFPDNEAFYDDLLSIAPHEKGKDNAAVAIKPTVAFIEGVPPIAFTSVKAFIAGVYAASKQSLMPIGIIRNGQAILFQGNLIETTFTVQPEDDIIIYKV